MTHEGIPTGLGPRPAGPRTDPATQMSRARAAVLEQLGQHHEPTTVTVLARECGQHTNTVREHLDALASAGLVDRTTGPAGGRGRPAIRYTVVPPESVRPQMREYVNLVSALAEQIRLAMPEPEAFAVQAGRHLSDLVAPGAGAVSPTATSAAEAALRLLTDLGFDPAVDGDDRTGEEVPAARGDEEVLTVRLRECPLLEAARRHPEVVCSVHLGAILGVYEGAGESTEGVAVEAFAERGACIARLPVRG